MKDGETHTVFVFLDAKGIYFFTFDAVYCLQPSLQKHLHFVITSPDIVVLNVSGGVHQLHMEFK